MSRKYLPSEVGEPPFAVVKDETHVPLLNGQEPSSLSSSHTSGVWAPKPLGEQPKLPIIIMMVVQFLDNLTFSIIIPSLFSFINSFVNDRHHSEFLVGVIIAVNSAATFLFSPICGAWTDRRPIREVLIITSIFLLGGNLVYSFANAFWMILLGRILVGIGAGNQVVSQVWFSWITNDQQRPIIMGVVSMVQTLAIILGPAIAAAFANINFHLFGTFYVDAMTMPGYFSAILSLITIIMLFFFQEGVRPPASHDKDFDKSLMDRIKEYLSPPTSANTRAIITCIILSFTYGVSFTVFETVGTPMTDTFYGWGVWQNGVLYAVLGVEAILWIAVQTIFLTKIFSDRTIVLAASFITAISAICFCPFVFPGQFEVGRLGGFIPFWTFAVGAGLSGGSFAVGTVVLLTLFSRLTDGSEGQGIYMGYFNASRALSRIVAPLLVGLAFEAGGVFLVFVPTTVLLFIGLWVNMWGHSGMDYVVKTGTTGDTTGAIN